MQRECKVCQQTMEATHENWVWSRGKPEGRTCRVCKNERVAKARSTEEGREKANAANRKARATEEGRAKHNAASVKSQTKRYQTDKWYRLRVNLAIKTNKLLTRISNGGTPKDETCFKLFGASLMEVVIHFNRQLDEKGLGWTDYQTMWVCDHIRPVALAGSDVELKQMFLLDNCQVLTLDEHAIKSLEDNALIREHESV